MCVPIEQPFPSINPVRRGAGPRGGAPHDLVAPLRPSVFAQRIGRADAERKVDVRVGRHRGSHSRAVLASPECARHGRNTIFTHLTNVGHQWLRRTALSCELTPPSIMSCFCAWSVRRSRGDERPSWAPLQKCYLTVSEEVIYQRER